MRERNSSQKEPLANTGGAIEKRLSAAENGTFVALNLIQSSSDDGEDFPKFEVHSTLIQQQESY